MSTCKGVFYIKKLFFKRVSDIRRWLYTHSCYVTKWCTEAKFAYPARQSVIEENKELFQEGMKAIFTEFYDTARPEPQYSSEVTDIMGDTLQSVMFGGSSGADAAQLAQEQIEALN